MANQHCIFITVPPVHNCYERRNFQYCCQAYPCLLTSSVIIIVSVCPNEPHCCDNGAGCEKKMQRQTAFHTNRCHCLLAAALLVCCAWILESIWRRIVFETMLHQPPPPPPPHPVLMNRNVIRCWPKLPVPIHGLCLQWDEIFLPIPFPFLVQMQSALWPSCCAAF